MIDDRCDMLSFVCLFACFLLLDVDLHWLGWVALCFAAVYYLMSGCCLGYLECYDDCLPPWISGPRATLLAKLLLYLRRST